MNTIDHKNGHCEWAKLKDEDLETIGLNKYPGEVILVNFKDEKISMPDSFYFNAQEFFLDSEIEAMPWFDTSLFPKGDTKNEHA